MADNYFVTAVLVSHDGAEWLPEVIAALFAQSRKIDRIVAVDNGSKDGSAKLISNAGITLIKSDRESGFGDAIDLAIDATPPITDDKEELLWLLHDDCAPNRYALGRLIEGLKEKPQVAMVGPKLRGWRDRNQLLEIGISIAVNGARWTDLESGELDQGQHDEPKEVLAVSTAAALIRREIFEDIGGLDPNLAIFRDDVDLGWRLRLAGFSVVTAPEALAFHLEAAANEIRTVDVEEAFLHRPHLLDRRNAAFVLLANVSWWMLPWVGLQLLGSAAIRSIGYLVAKLPGYAADEIAAVGLLLIKPNAIRNARKIRKPKRLLSPRIIREFIPKRGSQIRLAYEKAIASISKRFNLGNSIEDESAPMSFADIGVLDENFDENLLVDDSSKSRLEIIRNRPFLISLSLLLLVDLFTSRIRFGSLSGGALPIAHGGAMDLINKFGESWHTVAMGSASPTPTWLALMGVASALTLGNVSFFFAAFFFLAPLIAFVAMYRVIKRSGLTIFFASVGGVIYALSPVIWNSINQGRLGTLMVALLLPSFISLQPFEIEPKTSWRKIYAITLFAGFIGAFSPILMAIWTIYFAALLVVDVYKLKASLFSKNVLNFLMTNELAAEKRRFAFFVIPVALNFPWSASLLLHPTQILLEAGLPVSGGSTSGIFLFNPGGASGVPLWIISPILLFLFVSLFSQKYSRSGLFSTSLLILALILSPLHISGHGSNGKFWSGAILVAIEAILIPNALKVFSELIPNLESSRLGLGHLVTALLAVITTFSILGTSIWAITVGANSLVKSGTPDVVPAFIASLSDTPARPKTLVILKSSDATSYFITRGSDLELGEPDVTVGTPPVIAAAVNDMVMGTGISASKIIGAYGIQYVFMRNPVDQNLVRTIDGLGGFTRSSATDSGIVWKVFGSLPRLSFINPYINQGSSLNSGNVSAEGNVTVPGRINLAEKYDGNWKLLLNGKPIPVTHSAIGQPVFDLPEGGDFVLDFDGTKRRALISIEGIIFLAVLVLALPAGRRRKELV
jgi:GT2 family glycosyltransferase